MAGIDSYVKLMLHCNGADAATSFPDESDSGHTVTAQDDAQVDTAQSVFGGASGLFDGTDDYLSVPDSDDWYLSGDWTIDFRVRFSSIASYQGLVSQVVDSSNYWSLLWITGGQLHLKVYAGGSPTIAVFGSWSPSIDTWYHIEVGRSGDDYYMFADGTALSGMSGTPDSDSFTNLAAALHIGRALWPAATVCELSGWIDEFRLSNGICRHTGNFTPPTSEYARFGDPRFLSRCASPPDRIPPHAVIW